MDVKKTLRYPILLVAHKNLQERYFRSIAKQMNGSTGVVSLKELPGFRLQGSLGDSLVMKEIVAYRLEEMQRDGRRWVAWWPGLVRGIKLWQARQLYRQYVALLQHTACELVGVWNGHKFKRALFVLAAKECGRKVVFFENGLLPDTTVMDFCGVNAAGSIPEDPEFFYHLKVPSFDPPQNLQPRKPDDPKRFSGPARELPPAYFFVPFQIDSDSQVLLHSRWISDMRQLFDTIVQIAQRQPRRHFVLKEHPSSGVDYQDLRQRAETLENVHFYNATPTPELIAKASGVITINSTVGLESLMLGKKVILLGDSAYDLPGLVKKVDSLTDFERTLIAWGEWQPDEVLKERFFAYLQHDYLLPSGWREPTFEHLEEVSRRLGEAVSSGGSSSFFLASTPLNIFNALAIASTVDRATHQVLCLIDQPAGENPYFEILQTMNDSPFCSVHLFHSKKGGRSRRQTRRSTLKELACLIARHPPSTLWGGNDRRVEFQFALHHARQFDSNVKGCYLDDGTFTYTGRRTRWLERMGVEPWVKRRAYGDFYEAPSTVGGSRGIEEVWAAYPDEVCEGLRDKSIRAIPVHAYRSNTVLSLASLMLERYGVEMATLQKLQALILLPHASLIGDAESYRENFGKLLQEWGRKGWTIGVKYHPRQSGTDPLALAEFPGVELLPAKVNFEALLMGLNTPLIVGDFSSALLNARWLRSDLRVFSLVRSAELSATQQRLLQLFGRLGITVVKNPAEVLQDE